MIQEMLISFLLRPLGKLIDHFSEKTKERAFVFFSLLLFLIYFVYNTSQFSVASYFPAFVAGCLCLGMMILSMLHSGIKPISFSPVLFGLWLLVGILIAVASLRFNTDWLSDAIIYLIACPVAFIVWGNIDHKKLFRILIRACILSFIVFFVISAFLFPITIKQYKSFFSNPNGASGYLTLVFTCLLVYSFQKHSFCKRVISWVLLGLSSGLLYYSNSRSGQLAAIATFVFTSILFVFVDRTTIKQRLFHHVIPLLSAVVVFVPGTLYIMQVCNRSTTGIENLPLTVSASGFAPSETAPLSLTKENPALIGNYSSLLLGENVSDPTGDDKKYINFDELKDSNDKRYDVLNKDFNAITTGRVDIWKVFLEKVTMWGTGEEPNFYIESMKRTYGNPHMTPLLFAYQYGWLCAVISLLFNILAGFKSIYFAKKNKEDSLALFPFAITITYGVIFMVETINTPFLYMITMFYYFIQTPLIRVFSLESDA